MGEQILSQVEVDALLKGLSNGDIKTEAEKPEETDSGEVKPYDFSNQERLVRGKLPTLEMINEKFCRSLRSSAFNVLKKTIDVAPEGTKTMKYEEFLRNIQVPASLNVFQMSPLRGQGLLAIDPALVFLIVDSYFGGDGRFHTRIEGRDFTNVEQAVIKKVVDVMLREMEEIWKAVHPVDFRFVRAEMNPQFVNIMGHAEHVVVSAFRMEIESLSNSFFFCIPYTTVEPIRDKLMGTHRIDTTDVDKRWSQCLFEQCELVPVSVAGEMGKALIHVSELLDLKPGDIIQLDRKAKDLLEVSIEGIPKFRGRAGTADNNYAVKIMGPVERG